MHALLSEHWHAVRFLRPRLRDGVQTLHRYLRGHAWVLLFDPITQRFHRMTPQAWNVLKLFDGRRTLEEIWGLACAQAESHEAAMAAISQQELVQLLATLHANDLLQTQVSPDSSEIFERHERQFRQRLRQNWLNPLSLRIPILRPDAWFERRRWLAHTIVSWQVLVLWVTLVLPATVLGWQHWSELTENLSDRVLSNTNVVLLWCTYPLVKAFHEAAHGLVLKAFGGTVREVGLMFVAFTPVPYVDATSSYRFPSKWARALVAAAGIMVEMGLGALAMFLWLMAEPGIVTAIAFNVILIAGVSTVLINGNPLMRYDGYFILCDLLEVPNLAQRASQYWVYLIDRFGFGSRDSDPPIQSEGERVLLFLYGAISPIYRLSITFGLIWFVASEYLFVGMVMAAMAIWSTLLLPLWKSWKHLTRGASLARRREIARVRTIWALLLVAVPFCVVPVPFRSVHQAVVWVPDEAILRAESPGHVVNSPVPSGSRVRNGDVILQLDNPQLVADVGLAAGLLEQSKAQLRRAEVDHHRSTEALRSEVAARSERLVEAERRLESLTIRARDAGRWAPKPETELPGRHFKRGQVVGYVVGGPSSVVRTAITQEDMDFIRSHLKGVQVRLVNAPDSPIDAQYQREVPGGDFELVSAALGTSGGGEIAVDPSHQGGTHTLQRVFDVELKLTQPSTVAAFGDRAHVRFDLGSAPLAWQGFLRLRQLLLARLNV